MRAVWLLVIAACGEHGTSPTRELFRGDVWGGNLAVADGVAYWTTYDEGGEQLNQIGLYAAPLAGGDPVRLSVGNSHGIPGFGMTVAGGRVFWSGQRGDGLTGAAVFGDSIGPGDRTVAANFSVGTAPRGVVADARAVYASGSELLQIPLDGSPPTSIGAEAHWIALDGDRLIVERGGAISQISLATHAETPIAHVDGVTGNFAVDNGVIFVPAGTNILRLRNGGVGTIPAGDVVASVAAHGGELYAIRSGGTARDLVRISEEGGAIEPLVSNVTTAFAIVATDDGVVFARCSCGPVGGQNGTIELVPP